MAVILPTTSNMSEAEAQAWGYDAKLVDGQDDDIYLRIIADEQGPLRIVTADPGQQLPSRTVGAEEETLRSGTLYSQSDFTGGDGFRERSDPAAYLEDYTRYWRAEGMDLHSDPNGIGVQPYPADEDRTADLSAAVQTTEPTIVSFAPLGFLFVKTSTGLDKITGIHNASFTVAEQTNATILDGHSGTVGEWIANLGYQIYAAISGDGIHVRNGGTEAWSHWSDLNSVDRMWGVKDRIIASVGTALYEADSGADSVLLHTLGAGETWVSVVDGGAAILAASSVGTVYAFADESGTLRLRGRSKIEGEGIEAMATVQGFVFIGTNEAGTTARGRLWRAQVGPSYTLEARQVLRMWEKKVTSLASDRDDVWIGLRDTASNTAEVWRFHLPAAAVSHAVTALSEEGSILDIESNGDRLFYLAYNDTTVTMHRQDPTDFQTAWLISPLIDLGTAEAKVWTQATLEAASAVTGTGSIKLYYATNADAIQDDQDAGWTLICTLTATETIESVSITSEQSRWLALKAEINSVAAEAANVLLRIAARGSDVPDETLYEFNVNVSDQIERPGKRAFTARGFGDALFDELIGRQGNDVTVTFYQPSLVVDGILEAVASGITDQTSMRGSVTDELVMRVRGILQ